MQSFSPLHAFAFFILATSAFAAEALGQFNGQTDIGSPKLSGSATYDCAFADEFCAAAQNEIALHLFPDEMKLIRAEPHVRARASECVFLRGGIVSCRTGQLRGADVGLA